jgi:ABC-2 type transport system permease protein
VTIAREFFSNFTKIKRTSLILLHLLSPVVITTLFLVYYNSGGYHIFSDVRLFFILLQMCYPIFVSIVVPVFINLDRNISNVQNALGIVGSRKSVYLGKLLFLLFLSAISIIIYELCFFAGVNFFLNMNMMDFGSYFFIFCSLLLSNLFLYFIHVPIAFKFGFSISVLLGIAGTILAGYFENSVGDKIWPAIPWEWGVRFLKNYFDFSGASVIPGLISLIIMTSLVLVLTILWYSKWEGRIMQE